MRDAWIVLCFVVLAFAGCAKPPLLPVFAHYDECAAQNLPFTQMVACGKQRRMAYCQQHNNCTPDGNAYVQYADALALAVERRQMTESDAQMKLVEYRTSQVNQIRTLAIQQQAANAQTRAAINQSGPVTCTRSFNSVTCY
jgi:hypothetical protein